MNSRSRFVSLLSNPSSGRPKLITAWRFALVASLLSLPASQLVAQDNWPPDDEPSNGVPQQQYPSSPQYSYAPQQQYAQPPAGQQYAQPYPEQQGYGQQLAPAQPVSSVQPISPDQLTQLVAPIALYPDGLVAQILAASTYPAQLAAADQWLRSMGNAPPEQIAAAANMQSNWDPSVKALTAFPQVLEWLAQNLQWTTTLGNAYYNQPQDVLQTIQVMRQRAEEAGNLQSTPQEEVTQDQGAIDIAPTNPQVVYVPTYNPWAVYGAPVAPYPGFSLLGAIGSFFGSSPVQFGLSFAMNAFMHTPWGFLGWGLDWLAHSVLFNHSGYYTQSASVRDWGFPHGGPRARFGAAEYSHNGGYGYGRSSYGYGSVHSAYNRPAEQFNRGYAYNRPQSGYGDARSAEGFNRGFPSRAEPVRPQPQMAYSNRYPQPFARSPQFAARQPSYDQRSYAYQNRSNSGSYSYRPPENSFRGQTSRNYDAYRGNDYARSQSYGGSHFFGGRSEKFSAKAPKYSSGGHSSWGGGGGWKAPKESHFGGGHSGGGHSGGGHSGGGHSGHHH